MTSGHRTAPNRSFEFVVEETPAGWMILGGPQPLGPFLVRSHALDLALGMASAMRQMGDTVTVSVRNQGSAPPRR